MKIMILGAGIYQVPLIKTLTQETVVSTPRLGS